MKKIRRLHLYLGCFFTPLLFLYIFTGFMLTRETGTLKGENDAETFMQKLSSLHMRQFYPTQMESPPIAELKTMDPEKDTLTTVERLQYTNGTPVKLTGLDLPDGLDNHITYHTRAKGPKTLTLHASEDNGTQVDLLSARIGDDKIGTGELADESVVRDGRAHPGRSGAALHAATELCHWCGQAAVDLCRYAWHRPSA